MVSASHNLAKFESYGGYLTAAISDAYESLVWVVLRALLLGLSSLVQFDPDVFELVVIQVI